MNSFIISWEMLSNLHVQRTLRSCEHTCDKVVIFSWEFPAQEKTSQAARSCAKNLTPLCIIVNCLANLISDNLGGVAITSR